MSPGQFKIEDIRYLVTERCQRIYLPSEFKVEEEIKAIQQKMQQDTSRFRNRLDTMKIEDREEEEKEEIARQLEIQLKMDRNSVIEKTLVFGQGMRKYKKDRGLQPAQRFGD